MKMAKQVTILASSLLFISLCYSVEMPEIPLPSIPEMPTIEDVGGAIDGPLTEHVDPLTGNWLDPSNVSINYGLQHQISVNFARSDKPKTASCSVVVHNRPYQLIPMIGPGIMSDPLAASGMAPADQEMRMYFSALEKGTHVDFTVKCTLWWEELEKLDPQPYYPTTPSLMPMMPPVLPIPVVVMKSEVVEWLKSYDEDGTEQKFHFMQVK